MCRRLFSRPAVERRLPHVTVFVGRAKELAALTRVLRASSQPTAALVTGVAGSGKSRLLAEARRSAPRLRSFAVVGFESEREVPLAAAAGLLRALAATPEHGAALEALVFGRDNGHLHGDVADREPLDPLRIFEGAHRAIGAGKRTLLIIDDLHWVDDMSLALCHYLVRSAVESGQRIAVLAATRPADPGEQLFETLPEGSVQRIDLGPLAQDEGEALVRRLDPRLAPDAARGLWRQAKGNVFWLEALARYGIEEGGSAAGSIGGGLDQILTRRLRGAGRDAATLLAMLALAGRPVTIEMAAETLERDPEAVETALRALLVRGLVETDARGARPAHDLIRTTAVAQLSSDLRVQLHGTLADRIERDAGTDVQLLRLALEHRRAARLPTLPLAMKLATSPQRRLLGVDGVRDLGAVADEAISTSRDGILLQDSVAALAFELGEDGDAMRRWSWVAERAEDVVARAEAALKASRAAQALGRPDEAQDLLEYSRELVSDDPVLAVEQMTHQAALSLWRDQHGPEGRVLARRASSMARHLKGERRRGGSSDRKVLRAIVDALRVEYEAALQQGDPESLLRIALERDGQARRAGTEAALEATLSLGVAFRQNGRARQSVTRFRRVWAEAQRALFPRLSVDAGFWLGQTLVSVGELEEAEQTVHEVSALVGRVGDVARARHGLARLEATLHLERNRVAEGLALLEHDITHQPSDHQRLTLHGNRALWAARLEEPSAPQTVRGQLDAAEVCVLSVGCPRCTGELLLLTAEALSRIGLRDQARAALDRRDALDFPLMDLDRLMYRHAAALAADTAEDRASALGAALDAAESLPYRLRTLWIRLDLAQSLAPVDHDRAVRELKRTIADAESRGASTVRELAARSLRTLGVRTWRRRAAGGPLTVREGEVARLVAAGATNREVASTLFLSPKTVERHLVNLFRKLDVRNRTELAARIGELGTKTTGIPR